jgi:asparagine synthase (glutamine-hydrolysing)
MCRLWFSVGCSFTESQLRNLRSDLDHLLIPGGPDYQSLISNSSFTAYHSRLAIQGLNEKSNQPFFGRNGSVLLFNGEILNWRSLLEILSPNPPQSFDSDTQFLSYILDSGLISSFLSRFRGFFAFIYYNPTTNTLLSARDCYGVKPLYQSIVAGKYLAFASTSEALASHPYLSKSLNPEGFREYLKYGFFPFGLSAFHGIRQSPPGKLVSHNLDQYNRYIGSDEVLSFGPLDSLKQASANLAPSRFSPDLLLGKLIDSCKLRAVSDVPISLFLSGGIDSSLLALVYSKYLDIKPQCFTLKFSYSPEGDESDVAAVTASSLGLEHHILPFSSSDITDSVERVFQSLDQPFVDTSIIPTFILCDFVSRSYKVAISADGGDEAYAGYPKYQRFASIYSKISRLSFLPASAFRFLPFSNCYSQKIQKLIAALTLPMGLTESIYFLQHQIWPNTVLAKLIPGLESLPAINSDDLAHLPSRLSCLQYLDIIFYMLDDILYKIDRASMAHGLELREPMLDQELVSYGLLLPDSFKISKNRSKACFRDLVDHHLPHISRLPKKGFGIPLDLLYKSDFMQDNLSDFLSASSQLWDVLDRSVVLSILESRRLTDNQEWQLRSLFVWCQCHSL